MHINHDSHHYHYRCNPAIEKLSNRYALSRHEAESIFVEMLKWLFFTANKPESIEATIYDGMAIIDEAWHEFILCTDDYEWYCKETFGKIIHHYPSSKDNWDISRRILEQDSTYFERLTREKVGNLIRGVSDLLGVETASLWFGEYPRKYSPEVLLCRQISVAQHQLGSLNRQPNETLIE